jgi:hypothetical protein
MYNHVANVSKIGFSKYLPNPLRTLTPRIPKRQLVVDIENSTKYMDNFPILERLDNFNALWDDFVARVTIAATYLNPDAYSEFMGKWSIFQPN